MKIKIALLPFLWQKKGRSDPAKGLKGYWARGGLPIVLRTHFWGSAVLIGLFIAIKDQQHLYVYRSGQMHLLQSLLCGWYPILASQLTCRWCLWSIRVQALWNAGPLCSAYLCAFSVHSDVSQYVSCWNVKPSLHCCLSTLGNTAEFVECQNKIGHWDCVRIWPFRSPSGIH